MEGRISLCEADAPTGQRVPVVDDRTAQIRTALDEIHAKLDAVDEAVLKAPASPELTTALLDLSLAVQAADDIVPDAPAPVS